LLIITRSLLICILTARLTPKSLNFTHAVRLCTPHYFYNKQRLFPYRGFNKFFLLIDAHSIPCAVRTVFLYHIFSSLSPQFSSSSTCNSSAFSFHGLPDLLPPTCSLSAALSLSVAAAILWHPSKLCRQFYF
jgi:hypothetical protein